MPHLNWLIVLVGGSPSRILAVDFRLHVALGFGSLIRRVIRMLPELGHIVSHGCTWPENEVSRERFRLRQDWPRLAEPASGEIVLVKQAASMRKSAENSGEESSAMIDHKFDPSTHITEIVISGDVTDADIQATTAELERQMEANGSLRILQIIEDVGEVEPSPFWENVPRQLQKDHPQGKAAIVTDRRWKTWFSEMLHPYIGGNIRIFEMNQKADARAWLNGNADKGDELGKAKTG